jgi:hypothetical protein
MMTLWAAHKCDGHATQPVWQWLRIGLLLYTAGYLIAIYIAQLHVANQYLWITGHLADGGLAER